MMKNSKGKEEGAKYEQGKNFFLRQFYFGNHRFSLKFQKLKERKSMLMKTSAMTEEQKEKWSACFMMDMNSEESQEDLEGDCQPVDNH